MSLQEHLHKGLGTAAMGGKGYIVIFFIYNPFEHEVALLYIPYFVRPLKKKMGERVRELIG